MLRSCAHGPAVCLNIHEQSQAEPNQSATMILLPPQMYREFHLSIVIAKKMRMKMKTRVSRNLFGAPERKESVQLLQETLDQERTRFQKRWSVDPLADDDDKENGPRDGCNAIVTPNKRSSPYAKQTSIHDFWRTRKMYESGKMSPSGCSDTPKPVFLQSPPKMQSLSLTPTKAQQQQPQQTLPLAELQPEPQAQSTTEEAQPLLDIQQHTIDNQLDNVKPSTN